MEKNKLSIGRRICRLDQKSRLKTPWRSVSLVADEVPNKKELPAQCEGMDFEEATCIFEEELK